MCQSSQLSLLACPVDGVQSVHNIVSMQALISTGFVLLVGPIDIAHVRGGCALTVGDLWALPRTLTLTLALAHRLMSRCYRM